MSSLIGSIMGAGQQNANNPGVDYGGLSGFLSKMDPIGNKITEIGGDPLNIYGHKNNPNALLFPGGQNPNANGVPSVLPNLGTSSMMPQMPMGSFQQFNGGGGPFNQMAANSMGGQIFNPKGGNMPQSNQQIPPQMAQQMQFQRPMMGNVPRGYTMR